MFCAAIPVTAAVGVKLNADQLHKETSHRLPIPRLTTTLIGALIVASVLYHTSRWQG
jgi:hypothetical protein